MALCREKNVFGSLTKLVKSYPLETLLLVEGPHCSSVDSWCSTLEDGPGCSLSEDGAGCVVYEDGPDCLHVPSEFELSQIFSTFDFRAFL